MLLGFFSKWEESVSFSLFIVFTVEISLSSILVTLNKYGTLQKAHSIVTYYFNRFNNMGSGA